MEISDAATSQADAGQRKIDFYGDPNGTPISNLPMRSRDRSFLTGENAFNFYPSSYYQANFIAPANIIYFHFGVPGVMDLSINGQASRRELVQSHAMVFQPQGVRLSVTNTQTLMDLIALQLGDGLCLRLLSELNLMSSDLDVGVNISTPDTKAVCELIWSFMANDFAGGRLVGDSLATMAFAEVVRHQTGRQRKATQSVTKLDAGRLARVSDFIEQNLSAPIKVEAAAQVAGMSAFHFARAFKASTGLPPGTYINQRRLVQARRLLEDTGTSLADIAFQCGFSTQAYFTTVFRDAFGLTPGKYRKMCTDR